MKGLFSLSRSRLFIGAVVSAILVVGGVTFAYGAGHLRQVEPDTTVFYQANVGTEVIGGQNNGSGVGVEGIVGTTAGAIGMLGVATSTVHANIGMEGLAFGPSSVGLYGQGLVNADAAHPTVGLLGTSTSGFGVEGQSLITNTAGVDGVASDGLTLGQLGVGSAWGVHGTLSGTNAFESAVDGEAGATGTFSTGTFGLSGFLGGTSPAYGVIGSGTFEGVLGGAAGLGDNLADSSIGVFGEDTGGGSFPDFNNGMTADSTFGIGMLALAGGQSPNFRPVGFSTALWVDGGNASTGTSYAVGEELEAGDSNTDLLYAYNDVDGRLGILLPADGNLIEEFGSGSFTVDSAGNESLSGLITTSGFCSGGCSRTRGGRHELTYAAQSSEPTVEDYGEGQLVSGSANVRLDASFANAIDGKHGFLVFLTPEGDNRGLYVTKRTPTGFTVRESQGGTSTLGFMYRVIAKPYGVTAARLPMVNTPSRPVQPGSHALRSPRYLDLYQTLVAKVGKTRADQLVRQYLDKIKQQQTMQRLSPHADSQGRLHLGSTVVRVPNPN
jgi:hypothetical protein